MKEIEISNRKIGPDHKPLLIAEIGINHNGSLDEAKKIVDAAVLAGIEVIKHQTHVVEDEMSPEAQKVIPGNSDKSIYQIMEECALSEDDEIALKEYVEQKGCIFISTPFSRAAADRLERMGVEAYKIGSGECNNLPLLDHVSDFGKPMIISTGMNSLESVHQTVSFLKKKNAEFALLHTTNLYPTPNNLVRLGAMEALMNEFPDLIIGLSDHTISNHACFGAVALGASILERHFTDTMTREGPDIICSMDPIQAKDLIEGANILFSQRGGSKEPAKEEQVTIDFAFATVVSIADISKGDSFTKENLWVKRPGTGEILAAEYQNILGKKANKFIPKNTHLRKEDII
jgi:sialic acid synthase SpsE